MNSLIKQTARHFRPKATLTRPLLWAPVNQGQRFFASESKKPPTAVLLTNMGGPETLDDVHSFLHNLFSDRDLMQLPFQKYAAKYISRRRTPQIKN
ncbi:unnamed protein product [Mucor hiemalis]